MKGVMEIEQEQTSPGWENRKQYDFNAGDQVSSGGICEWVTERERLLCDLRPGEWPAEYALPWLDRPSQVRGIAA